MYRIGNHQQNENAPYGMGENVCTSLFIYLLLAALVCCFVQALSGCSQWGLLCCIARAPHYGGFSCCRARVLGAQALEAAAHGLSSCGSRALDRGLRSCGLRESYRTRDRTVSPAFAGGFLSTVPPGKSSFVYIFINILVLSLCKIPLKQKEIQYLQLPPF